MSGKKKSTRKTIIFLADLFECFAAMIEIILTIILFVIQDTVSYEKASSFEPVSKSRIWTIMEYNPIIGYGYIVCTAVIVVCAIGRMMGNSRTEYIKEEK